MRELTEADLERIRAEARMVRDKAMGVYVAPERKARPRSNMGASRKGITISRPPVYNRRLIVKLYHEGKRVSEIAEETGAHRATVSRVLKQTKVDLRPDHGGPTRRETCARDHSMDDAIELPGGGRACRTCKRIRDREAYYRKKERNAEVS